MDSAEALRYLGSFKQYAMGNTASEVQQGASNVEMPSAPLEEQPMSAQSPSDSVDLSAGAQAEVQTQQNVNSFGLSDLVGGSSAEQSSDAAPSQQRTITLSGGENGSNFDITVGSDGSYVVCIDGQESVYSAGEAEKLIVNGGKGNDSFNIHQDGKLGKGNLEINAGAGDDVVKVDSDVERLSRVSAQSIQGAQETQSTGASSLLGELVNEIAGVYDNKLTINGGDGNDKITVGDDVTGKVVINGGAGNDTIQGGSGDDTIDGGAGDDTIYGGAGYDTIDGGDGNDFIDGEEGGDTINGGAGNDTISDWQGSNHIDGGDGNDNISTKPGFFRNIWNGIIEADDVGSTIEGGLGDDTITCGDGNDVISDKGGSNTIDAGDGKNKISLTVAPGTHNEVESGYGNSTATVNLELGDQSNGQGVAADVTLDGRDYTIGLNGQSESVSLEGFDKLTLNGSQGDDKIFIHQDSRWTNSGLDVQGGDGNDIIRADADVRSDLALRGGNGNDTIQGGAGRDFIDGGNGNDTLEGGAGGDVIYGGNGHDTISGGAGNDFINGGNGDDVIHGGAGNDVLFGLRGNDQLYGEEGNDVLIGGRGDDVIDGGSGKDTIRSTSGEVGGNDTVVGSDAQDDSKVLNPIDVPANFKISGKDISGTFGDNVADLGAAQSFDQNIKDNLEAFADIEPGQNLLNQYAATGHKIDFTETGDANGYARAYNNEGKARVSMGANGARTWEAGSGCDSEVSINPAFIEFNTGDAWHEQNTMVIMAHEMSHAYNNAMGNMDYTYYNDTTGKVLPAAAGMSRSELAYNRGVRGAEFQAVGIHDESTISPNPYGISENDYREYFNMEQRTSYYSQKSR